MVETGIPVMGHIGLTPQSVHEFGGYKVQGRGAAAGEELLLDAQALVEAGVFSIVLEGIPAGLASRITKEVPVPTIGIGAGVRCDGQVLVIQDLLGMDERFQPKFVKRYADGAGMIKGALEAYAREVRDGTFPGPEHSFE
jgi:3-methyl-2-oxobutanoate hydroxymethyltransferase